MEKIKRGRFSEKVMALLLAVGMVFTMSLPIGVVQAAEIDSGEPIMLSGFAELAEEVREQNVPLGVSLGELDLPDTLEATAEQAAQGKRRLALGLSSGDVDDVSGTVTVEGVTWESDPEFDGDTEGEYIFTAVLPEGYSLADGVAMPIITVTVGEAEQSAVDKVIAMIDALPSYAELTANTPADTDPEYAAWLAKTKQTLDEILAVKAAYDALSDEDKAKIDEARTAKLLELAELAQQMASLMPMVDTLNPVTIRANSTDAEKLDVSANGSTTTVDPLAEDITITGTYTSISIDVSTYTGAAVPNIILSGAIILPLTPPAQSAGTSQTEPGPTGTAGTSAVTIDEVVHLIVNANSTVTGGQGGQGGKGGQGLPGPKGEVGPAGPNGGDGGIGGAGISITGTAYITTALGAVAGGTGGVGGDGGPAGPGGQGGTNGPNGNPGAIGAAGQAVVGTQVVPPTISKATATDLTDVSATLSAAIAADGNTVTEAGFFYKSASDQAWTSAATGTTDSITLNAVGLTTKDVEYTVRAYATVNGKKLVGESATFTPVKAIPAITVTGTNIFANGAPLLLVAGTTEGNTVIYTDVNGDGELDVGDILFDGFADDTVTGNNLATYDIYGGSDITDLTADTQITIRGGTVNDVFGGSRASKDTVTNDVTTLTGSTKIVMYGGTVKNVLGGSNSGFQAYNFDATVITGATEVTILGGIVEKSEGIVNTGNVFGGSANYDDPKLKAHNKATILGGTTVTVGGTAKVKSVYGGGASFPSSIDSPTNITSGGTIVTVSGEATVTENVYGGGLGARGGDGVVGNTKVTITDVTVGGSVYGGGNGPVDGSTSVTITGVTVGGSVCGGCSREKGNVTGDTKVTLTNVTVGDTVYGGGTSGESTAIGGSTEVIISGGKITKDVYGGNSERTSTIDGNTSVTITDVEVGSYVYGGSSTVKGDASVTISGTTTADKVYGSLIGTVSGNVNITINGAAVVTDVYAGTTGTPHLTIGGNVKIGGTNGTAGLRIRNKDTPNGVDNFAIDPDLGTDSKVYVCLPGLYDSSNKPIIATGATEGDFEKIVLTGASGKLAYLDGTDIRVREENTNTFLSNMTISAGTLLPVFNKNTSAYTVQVPNEGLNLTVTPTPEGEPVTITVDGTGVADGAASQEITMKVGTVVTVKVAGERSTYRNYTITGVATPEIKPEITIDFTTEKLTGFVASSNYYVNEDYVWSDDTTYPIPSRWMGKTVSIVKKGATVAQDSPPQQLIIPARPGTPRAHTIAIGPTTIKVTPVAGEEYSIDSWATKNTDGEFTGLDPCTRYTIQSRVAVTATSFQSGEYTESKTTPVSFTAPTGSEAGKGAVTIDKTEAAAFEKVTYTVTFEDGYTPTLTLSGNNNNLWDPTKSNTENKWTYDYSVSSKDRTVGAAVSFTARAVASISAPSAAVSLFADDTNNATAAALKSYLDGNVKVTVNYDNGTTMENAATYTLSRGTWTATGGSYTYTATVGDKTCDVTVTVKPITAAITAIPNISKPINASGYTTHAGLGLPTTATITYTGDGYTTETESLAVTWSAIPTGFGKTGASETFTGMVSLPAWATGGKTTTTIVTISSKSDISTKLTVTIDGWGYGEAATTPSVSAEGITLDQSKAAYTYSGTASDGTSLTDSGTAPVKSGSYTVTAKYDDSTQIGSAVKSFTVAKAPLTITGGTVPTREYKEGDKTATVTAVEFSGLKNNEKPVLGTDYTVTASFEDDKAGAKKPVTGTVALKPTSATAANYTLPSGALNNIFGSITGGPKADISAKLTVAIGDWAYGDAAKTPTTTATGVTIDQSKLTYTYSGTASDGTALTDSTAAPVKSGSYTVTAKYEDDTQIGSAAASFTVAKAPLTITGGTVKSRGYIAGDRTATITAVTFGGLKNGETPAIGTDYTVTGAEFADANVGIDKPVTATVALVATAKTANYTLSNSVLNTTGTITQETDGTKNPDYATALAELQKVHIITNATPTLETVKLPADWSFTGDKTAKLIASGDNGGKQNFAVKYTSRNPNYPDVAIAAQPFPVSTVTVAMSKLEVVVINAIGGEENLSATITVTGAPLANDIAIAGMEWRSSCPEIVSLSGASMGGTASVTAKGTAKGVSMVGVAYKGGDMLGYVLVKVIDNRDDSANTIDQIKDITDTLDKLVDKDNPTAGDKGAVNAVADEVTKLPEAAKDELTEQDVKALDELKQQVNGTLTITIDKTPEGTAPPAPTGVTAVGTAIACGVDSGVVTYYVTPIAPTGTDTKLELKLEMDVSGSKEQLKAPLFFTMTLPSGVDVSKLKIKHIMESGEEEVTYTAIGQTVSFKLSSFSGLKFIVESDTPTPPPAGDDGGSGGSDDGQYDFWEKVKDEIDKADDGDVIKADAKDYDKMPESVMDELRKNPDVTIVIKWNGGDDITIPAGKAQPKDPGRIYWPLSLLAELYGGITFNVNPETGGPGYIVCADGKAIPITGGMTELDAPPVTVGAPDAKVPEITPPTAGFEPDAYAGTPDARAASGVGLWAAVLVAMLTAAIIGVLLWKKRPIGKKD